MNLKRLCWLAAVMTASLLEVGGAHAADLVIRIPKRSKATPVQSLNQEGVEALRKNQTERAKNAFFKAYLLDPNDPFTLNNLAYIAETEGDAARAQRLYALASQQGNNAAVAYATSKQLEGKPFQTALQGVHSVPMQINHANFQALYLFSQNRAMEADVLLQNTLRLDPDNPFTLNNIGVAKEMEGDFTGALQNYSAAANVSAAKETAVMASNKGWSGRPIRQVASDNANRLRSRMEDNVENVQAQAALLNFRGVSALNRNAWREAANDFLAAYKADPDNAFSLNNAGYVAEMDGDLETAQSFYQSARRAPQADAKIGLATRTSAEGLKLFAVAEDSDGKVANKIDQERELRRRETGPIRLKHRDGTPVMPESEENPSPTQTPDNNPSTNAPR